MFNQLGIDFVQGYGLTETSPITHLNPVEAYIETSVGKKVPQVEVKIVNPDSDGERHHPYQGTHGHAGLLQQSRGYCGSQRMVG